MDLSISDDEGVYRSRIQRPKRSHSVAFPVNGESESVAGKRYLMSGGLPAPNDCEAAQRDLQNNQVSHHLSRLLLSVLAHCGLCTKSCSGATVEPPYSQPINPTAQQSTSGISSSYMHNSDPPSAYRGFIRSLQLANMSSVLSFRLAQVAHFKVHLRHQSRERTHHSHHIPLIQS